jgi:hypothetical protein
MQLSGCWQMSLILFTLLWLEPMAEPLAATVPLAAFAQDKSLFEGIGNAVRDAMKAIGGKEARPRAVAPPLPAMKNPPGPEQDKQENKARLEAYSNSMRLWIEQTCELSDEQRTKSRELFEKDLDYESWWRDSVAKANNQQQRGNQVFGNCFPILFTMKTGGVATNFQRQINKELQSKVLTADQQQRLKAALDERVQFRSTAFRDYIISLLDKELYLTNDQRAKLSAELNENQRLFDHGLYAFQPQSYYLPYESITTVVRWGNPALTKPQQKLYELTSNTANRTRNAQILFESGSGLEGWYKQIDQVGIEERDTFLRAVAVRIAYYEAEMGITTEQAEQLTVAGKGAAVSALATWKESTRATVDRMEQQMVQMRGNFAFAVGRMTVDGLEKNEIWLNTLKTILPAERVEKLDARSAAIRLARANAVLAMLDHELWLRADQRKPLLELIEPSLPRRDDTLSRNQDYLREIALLAHPLYKIPDAKINPLLNEHQQAAWKQMKSYFRKHDGGNYLLVPMKMNGGELAVQLSD